MTNEISGKEITNFVSTGPGSYSFKYGNGDQKSAIKGFTLNYKNGCYLNHDSLAKVVKKQLKEMTIRNESKLAQKNQEIVNKYCEKAFTLGYDKSQQRNQRRSYQHITLWLLREKVIYFPKILVFIKLKKILLPFPLSNLGIHTVEKI